YFIDIRNLSDGLWWLLLVFPAVWLADTSAFFVGSRWGKHKLSPHLSPKKSWEGYLAGIFFGTVGTIGLSVLWNRFFGFPVAWWKGAFLGLLLSVMTTLGDLGALASIKEKLKQEEKGQGGEAPQAPQQ
ncbi:MAG: phosphatidate cytidylyltransferase, partial [Bacteroidota bacterium]|nr:phosphatidate cytidylyltransferase [Bacteroidota bacterium]